MLKTDHRAKSDARKAAKKKMDLGGLQNLQKMYQDYMDSQGKGKQKDIEGKVFQTRSGLVQIKDGKPEPIYKDPYMDSTSKVREESLGLRQDKFSHTKAQKGQDDAVKAIDSLRKTDTWKSAEKAISNIPEIEVLLDDAYKKGGQSLAMLGPRVAKGIAGEVGVLTEQDVTRYVKNPELVGGLLDTLKKAKSGQITEASYKNLKRLLQLSKKTATDKMNSAIDREAILFSRRENIPFEDAKFLLDSAYKRNTEDKTVKSVKYDGKKVRVQLPSGKIGKVGKDKIKALMKKYPNAKILE
jgi:hypothetical protein